MRYVEFSHRHGKELLQVLHPAVLIEVKKTIAGLPPFPHGKKKGVTVNQHITDAFVSCGWEAEGKADFRTDKDDYLDLRKRKVAIEMEFSRFEMFFRDFFRKSARASFQKLVDFLKGDYASVVSVPLWCIGIE